MRNIGKGFIGNLLEIDLSNQKIQIKPINLEEVKPFIGGKGYGAKLLWDYMNDQKENYLDAYDENNPLIFATGPLTGTSFPPPARACIVSISPLTGLYDDSHVGGAVGPELKYAGYDFVIIRGKLEKPGYIWIDDDKIEFKNADDLWGKDVYSTDELLKQKHKDRRIQVASIGPAGENLVKYACITFSLHHHAGRGGLGAVMGEKKLKAIAVRGTGYIDVQDNAKFKELSMNCAKAIEQDLGLATMKKYGTARSISSSNKLYLFPTRNHQEAHFEGADRINGDQQENKLWNQTKACFGCSIHCNHMGLIREGIYKGTIFKGIEYEVASLLGSNCGVDDVNAVAYASMVCDKLGLDALSTGSSIAWAIECYQKGIFNKKDVDNLDLKFGNYVDINKMIHQIAYRKGLGNLLAEGVKRASKKVGRGSEDFAMHVKGLELPGWGIRSAPSMGLNYATTDRGGCHQRAWPISYDLGSKTPEGKVLDRFGPEGKAKVTKYQQDLIASLYSLIACDFSTGTLGTDRLIKLLNFATGWDYDEREFVKTGERIWNLSRVINIKNGMSKNDDTLPKRIFREKITVGPGLKKNLPEEIFIRMLNDYYQERGWDPETGKPTQKKLVELGLGFVN